MEKIKEICELCNEKKSCGHWKSEELGWLELCGSEGELHGRDGVINICSECEGERSKDRDEQ